MPGLVGVAGDVAPEVRDRLLSDMTQALKHEDWYQVHLYTDEAVGCGRVSLGILNPEPQPIWNEDRSLGILMEGEVYDYEDEKRRLIERGHRFSVNNDAEFVLHAYEEYGPDLAMKLNGAFVLTIWNQRERRLTIVNDRFGLRPLFLAHQGGKLLFASGARAILADPDFRPRVDAAGLVEFLAFRHVLDDKTLLKDISLLPPASWLTYQDGQMTLKTYWQLEPPATYADQPESYYLEGVCHHMRQAVQRRMRGDGPVGVQLSGGRDSRAVLAFIDREHYPVHTFTFGIPGCDDARIASEIARKLNTQHHFYELRPDFLLRTAEEGVRLSDGLNSCIHMHGMAHLRSMAQHVRFLFTGSLGDSLIGGKFDRDLLAIYDETTLAQKLFHKRKRVFSEAEQADLFSDEFGHQVPQGHIFEVYRRSLGRVEAPMATSKRLYHSIRQANRRWILEGQRLLRSQVEVRLPFYDNDLVDFMLTVPPGWLLEGYLYGQAINQASPTLAKIPYDATGLPLVACMRDVAIRADRQLRWRLREIGLKWVPEIERKPYADYNGWMRTALRPWVEETLLSERALERGYFRPEQVRNVVAEHMAGTDHARKLGVLLTFELWHKLFLD